MINTMHFKLHNQRSLQDSIPLAEKAAEEFLGHRMFSLEWDAEPPERVIYGQKQEVPPPMGWTVSYVVWVDREDDE